jgi:TRAP-type uncharacterized transport system substrate-binding protein
MSRFNTGKGRKLTVGGQASSTSVDQALTDIAVSLRNICQRITWITTQVNVGGAATANLEAMGYSAQDAALVLSYMTWLGEVNTTYKTVDGSLSALWAMQV